MEGWIKLYRKFNDWEWFNISEMVHLYIYLLLNANHEDNEWRGIVVKRGQIVTGLHSLNSKTKISIRTLRTCLDRLKKTKEIDIQTTNKYSIITICNYESYQGEKSKADIQPTNNRQTTDKQTTTNKNDKNKKKFIEANVNDSFNFYLEQVTTAKQYPSDQMAKDYIELCRHICKKDKDGSWDMYFVLNIQKQISLDQFSSLYKRSGNSLDAIIAKVDSVQNKVDYHNTYTDLFKTINSWFINDLKRGNK